MEQGNVAEITVTVQNEHGLHARPADLFVRCANSYQSVIKLTNMTKTPEKKSNAKSILGVLSSGVHSGDSVRIVAEGDDCNEAVAALKELIESNFGE